MEKLDRLLTSWLSTPGISVWILGIAAAGSLLVAALCFYYQRASAVRVGRMARVFGRVGKLEGKEWAASTGGHKGLVLVEVDYAVAGKLFTCTTWRLFRGNDLYGQERFATIAPGREIAVFYDPRDPGFSALVIDRPSYVSAVIAAVLCIVFVGLAIYLAP